MKGKIVLIPFPFTDLTESKLRPALVLLERKDDVKVDLSGSERCKKVITGVRYSNGGKEKKRSYYAWTKKSLMSNTGFTG